MSAPLSIADILDRAADRISKPGAWTQHVYARTSTGRVIGPLEKGAACWCILGALWKEGLKPVEAIDAVRPVIERDTPHEWNDLKSRTQAEAVAKLREAATKAREEGQ